MGFGGVSDRFAVYSSPLTVLSLKLTFVLLLQSWQ